MIVLPDGKICRNLPEQVAENLKKIQEIIHYLDGVNVQDNLVVIADLSQILTEAELDVVERPVAFIYYNAELYIKKNEAAGVAYFVNVFSIEDTGTQLNFTSNEIQVNLGTGALAYTTATATSYTKDQIDSLLALKANDADVAKLTGAAFTGPITAPSIIEDMTGYSQGHTNLKYITYTYVSACKNGNKLTLVVAGKINVPTGETYSEYSVMGAVNFTIPSAVGLKIYPAGAGGDANALSAKIIQSFYNFSKKAGINVYCTKSSNTQLAVTFYGTNDSIDRDVNYAYRWEETFLLGDSIL